MLFRNPPLLPPACAQLRAKRAGDNWIVKDLVEQPFYRFLHWSYPLHSTMQVGLVRHSSTQQRAGSAAQGRHAWAGLSSAG